jgi:hypothetical protein
VLGTPPAFVLSQDQTLQFISKLLILVFRNCLKTQKMITPIFLSKSSVHQDF